MRVLLTGGLGYIGAHTATELINQGHKVVVLDNLSNTRIEVLDQLEKITSTKIDFLNLDICDYNQMHQALQGFSFDGIIHFAAKKSIPESLESPSLYYQNNITGLINVLRVSEALNIQNFVFSSSCTVYGIPNRLPVTEEDPVTKSESPYGNTKVWGEDILIDYAKLKKDKKIVLLRYFNPVGAHASGLIGELPKGVPSNLMPFITQTAAGIREKLLVFGKDYNTPDGTAIRDFIHVSDLANAHLKAFEWLANEKDNLDYEIFNVGTGSGYSVLNLIEAFENVNQIKLNWEFAPRRKGDIEKIWADPSKIRKTLNWSPKFDLNEMVKTAWKWQLQLKNH